MYSKSSILSDRETQVLSALVRAHVESGLPIGSRTLNERSSLGISSATIRATLANLEDKGYLQQPHTSAGRIPTEHGYRHYVEKCLHEKNLEDEQITPDICGIELNYLFEARSHEGDFNTIMTQLAQIIGDVSKQLGLVLSPRFEKGVLVSVELVGLSQERVLLVVTVERGLLKSLVLECEACVSRSDLQVVSGLLNERLRGLSLSEIQQTVRQRMEPLLDRNPILLRTIVETIENLTSVSGNELYTSGASNLCVQPEFGQSLQVAGLLELTEKKDVLAEIMSGRKGMVVTIGQDHPLTPLKRCGMVTASYEVNGELGVIGIIGPTRMPYASLMHLVNYTASRASQLVCRDH